VSGARTNLPALLASAFLGAILALSLQPAVAGFGPAQGSGGGGGETPTLAQVLAAGSDASGRQITKVSSLEWGNEIATIQAFRSGNGLEFYEVFDQAGIYDPALLISRGLEIYDTSGGSIPRPDTGIAVPVWPLTGVGVRTGNQDNFVFQGGYLQFLNANGGFEWLDGNAGAYAYDAGGDLGNVVGFWDSVETGNYYAWGFVELDEMSDAAAPGANKARLYCRDNGSGKSQLVVRFPSGSVQVLATEP
jgi:hypothetical protein